MLVCMSWSGARVYELVRCSGAHVLVCLCSRVFELVGWSALDMATCSWGPYVTWFEVIKWLAA